MTEAIGYFLAGIGVAIVLLAIFTTPPSVWRDRGPR